MNISKVYYEELKSKCINGKWESVKIGAEVAMNNNEIGYIASAALAKAREFVRESLNKERGYDVEKNKEVKKYVEQINKEIQCLLATIYVKSGD